MYTLRNMLSFVTHVSNMVLSYNMCCYLIKHNPGSSGLRCVVEEGSVSDPPAPPKAGKDYV